MNKSISISYSDTFLPADSFWVVFKQKPEELEPATAITYEEAADVIDALYEVKPCGTEEEQEEAATGGEENEAIFPTFADYQERMKSIFSAPEMDVNLCENVYEDKSYKATLQVYRSYLDKPYKLVLSNGSKDSKSSKSETKYETLAINGSTVDVEFPIRNIISSSQEVKDHNSKTILFTKELFGIVTVGYETSCDEVIITVKAEDNDYGSCECMLFYQGIVEELTVNPPDIDETATAALDCDGEGSYSVEDEGEDLPDFSSGTCYQRYIYKSRCDCTPYKTLDTMDSIREVPCSIPFSSETVQGVYNSFQDAVIFISYNRCPEEENWEGQDPEFYEDNCCEPPIGLLPTCKERKSIDYGGRSIVKGADHYINNAFSDETVNLVPVGPKDGICGEITTKYDVPSLDCCDDEFYTDLEINEEGSVEVMADNSVGYVMWSGGKYPVTFSVRGSGFYVNPEHTKTTVKLESGSGIIYTEDACGGADVSIEDGCSEDSYSIAANDGTWKGVQCGGSYPEQDCGAGVTDPVITTAHDYIRVYNYQDSKIKFYQTVQPSRSVYQRYASCGEACGQIDLSGRGDYDYWHVGLDLNMANEQTGTYWWGDCGPFIACEYWDGFTPLFSHGPIPGWSPVFKTYGQPIYSEWSC